MGHGERRGRRTTRRRFGRRNRVGANRYGRNGRRGGRYRRSGGGGLGILIAKLCVMCISGAVELIKDYQRSLDNTKEEQEKILQEKAKREEEEKLAKEKAEAEAGKGEQEVEKTEEEKAKAEAERAKAEAERAKAAAEEAERIKELQEDQMELLNDIMKRIAKEKNPDRLQTLFNQQNELIAQMTQLQGAGYNYAKEIPAPKEDQSPKTQEIPAPKEALYSNAQEIPAPKEAQ